MTEEQFDEWIKKLEDPETKKGKFRLKSTDGGMCCLGVLAEINNVPSRESRTTCIRTYEFKNPWPSTDAPFSSSSTIPKGWMGISRIVAEEVAHINDMSETFKPAIDYLKDHEHEIVE